MNQGNRQLRQAMKGQEHLSQSDSIGFIIFFVVTGLALHPLKVCTSTKGCSGTLDQDNPNPFRHPQRLKNVDQRRDHLFVKGILLVRTVQCDHRGTIGRNLQENGVGALVCCFYHLSFFLLNPACYIRNTPKRGGPMGAPATLAKDMDTTRRVCAGSMMPSSHKRAVE